MPVDKLRSDSEILIDQLNRYANWRSNSPVDFLSNTEREFISHNRLDLEDVFTCIEKIVFARDDDEQDSALKRFRDHINFFIKGSLEWLKKTAELAQAVKTEITDFEEFLSRAEKEREYDPHMWKLIAQRYIGKRRGLLFEYDHQRSVAMRFQEPITFSLDQEYELRPEGSDTAERLWARAAILIKDIKNHPRRLRFCIHCHLLFWDKSKSGNKKYCYRQECEKAKEQAKQDNFFEQHGGTTKYRASLRKRRKRSTSKITRTKGR